MEGRYIPTVRENSRFLIYVTPGPLMPVPPGPDTISPLYQSWINNRLFIQLQLHLRFFQLQ